MSRNQALAEVEFFFFFFFQGVCLYGSHDSGRILLKNQRWLFFLPWEKWIWSKRKWKILFFLKPKFPHRYIIYIYIYDAGFSYLLLTLKILNSFYCFFSNEILYLWLVFKILLFSLSLLILFFYFFLCTNLIIVSHNINFIFYFLKLKKKKEQTKGKMESVNTDFRGFVFVHLLDPVEHQKFWMDSSWILTKENTWRKWGQKQRKKTVTLQ